MATLTVEVPVRPSEDPGKVRAAVLNIFPDAELGTREGGLAGSGRSLARFGEILKRYRIRDAARGVMLRGMRGDRVTVFRLSKQAAFVGRVSFGEGASPLGDITVRLEDDDLVGLIDQLAPGTRPPRLHAAKARSARPPGASRPPRGGGGERWDWRKEVAGLEEE